MKKLFSFMVIAVLAMPLFSQSLERSFQIKNKYINIPIDHAEQRQRVHFTLDGDVITLNDIRIANQNIDYWVFLDVSNFKGKKLTFNFSEKVSGIDKIYQSNKFVGEDKIYEENLRPQVHFSTKRGWTNDPNGMVYYKGEYHLFYQHNPYEIIWGNMTWGHAVSKDLLHWEELPSAILPDTGLGTIFSGSAVIDHKNTSGFKKGKEPPMVAFFTHDMRKGGKELKQQQSIAYSNDRGRTFTVYDKNPVIPAERRFGSGHERDPKLFWYAPGKHWVMILHDALAYSIFTSKNLKDWEYQSSVDAGFWECPELFELAVDGNDKNKKWVMYGVMGTYLIGSFDGKKFVPETEMLRYNFDGMSAAQTFNDEPNGRRLQIGWARAVFPDSPFRHTFTFVQEYKLKTTRNGVRLFINPIKEIEKLHKPGKSHSFKNQHIGYEINDELSKIKSPFLHIKAKFEIENAREFGIDINGYKIAYHVNQSQLIMRRNYSQNSYDTIRPLLPLQNKQLDLEIIVDNTTVEVYANGGILYWFYNNLEGDPDTFQLSLFNNKSGLNEDPKTLVKSLEIHELKSIWKK